MKLGKKQAAYGAVLGLAAVAFVVDRVFFTPESAEASSRPAAVEKPAAGEASEVSPASSASASAAPAIPAGWLAERFRNAGGSDEPTRDVFAVPACWRPAPKVVAVVAATPSKPKLLGGAFRRNHHLTAVLIETGNSRAVVDGNLVCIGGSIDGFRLVSLTRQAARFIHGVEQVDLTIGQPESTNVH